jgi:uncharacterized membrane protein YhaH (DUF805 family)
MNENTNRINRGTYALSLLVGFGAYIAVFIVVALLLGKHETPLLLVLTLLYTAVLTYTILIQVRRLHDMNYSGWLALLQLVPIVNIVFFVLILLKPGSAGTNNYGKEPQRHYIFTLKR